MLDAQHRPPQHAAAANKRSGLSQETLSIAVWLSVFGTGGASLMTVVELCLTWTHVRVSRPARCAVYWLEQSCSLVQVAAMLATMAGRVARHRASVLLHLGITQSAPPPAAADASISRAAADDDSDDSAPRLSNVASARSRDSASRESGWSEVERDGTLAAAVASSPIAPSNSSHSVNTVVSERL